LDSVGDDAGSRTCGSEARVCVVRARGRGNRRWLIVVDRRVYDRGFDAQVGGYLGYENFMQQFGEFGTVFNAPLDRLAEQHNSRPGGGSAGVDAGGDQPGQRDWPIGDDFGRLLHAVRILGRNPWDIVDRHVEPRQSFLPAPLDGLIRLEHGHVEPLGSAAPPWHCRRQQRPAHIAAAARDRPAHRAPVVAGAVRITHPAMVTAGHRGPDECACPALRERFRTIASRS
jgi:hypothetical protein